MQSKRRKRKRCRRRIHAPRPPTPKNPPRFPTLITPIATPYRWFSLRNEGRPAGSHDRDENQNPNRPRTQPVAWPSSRPSNLRRSPQQLLTKIRVKLLHPAILHSTQKKKHHQEKNYSEPETKKRRHPSRRNPNSDSTIPIPPSPSHSCIKILERQTPHHRTIRRPSHPPRPKPPGLRPHPKPNRSSPQRRPGKMDRPTTKSQLDR